MAQVPGFGSNFPSEAFRANIKNVMRMAAPNAVLERVTFTWPDQKTYTGPTDHTGRPYSLVAETASVEEHEDVQVDCAVETIVRNPTGTPIGEFNNPQAAITMFDVDYEQVRGSTTVLIGGNTYTVNYVEPIGLFDVTVYTLHCQAVDES